MREDLKNTKNAFWWQNMYITKRNEDKQTIKELIELLGVNAVIYSKTDRWIRINNTTFNGFSKADIRNIIQAIGGGQNVCI